MDFFPLHLIGLLVIALCLPVSRAEECNSQRSQQCRSALQDELTRETTQQNQRRTTQTNQRQELQYHCRSLADNLNCLVWQTSNCLNIEERERNSDIINRSWKYLSSICDAVVGWRISQCFQRDDIHRCESLIRDSSRNANVDNCRKFVAFKECVENIVRYQCPVEDQSVMTLYILDQGREKAWKCSSAVGETTRYHDDIHYQTLPLSDNGEAQDAICLTRSQSSIRSCSDRYYEKIDEARRYRDAQDRMHRECCASIEFERCIRDTIRDYCTLVRNSLVQSILDQRGVRPDPRCRYYGENECSSAVSLVATFLLSAFLVIFSSGRGKWF